MSKAKKRKSVNIPREITIIMDDRGKVTLKNEKGRVITDQSVLRVVKKTPEYKEEIAWLDKLRLEKIEKILRESGERDEKFISFHHSAPKIQRRDEFIENLPSIRLQRYEPEDFDKPKPDEEKIRKVLSKEARKKVKSSVLKRRKERKKYIEDNAQVRLDQATEKWEKEKEEFENKEKAIKRVKDAEYRREHDEYLDRISSLLRGDKGTIESAFRSWITSCRFPFKLKISYRMDPDGQTMFLNIELPKIDILPQTIMTKTKAGNLKERKKKQSELRKEYAEMIFSLAILISANVFNISPAIRTIIFSAYTHQKGKTGNTDDVYLFSAKFLREKFEQTDLTNTDPQDFCMSFENRCKMTTTHLLRPVKPLSF